MLPSGEKRYVQYEVIAKRSLTYWGSYNPFQQATFYDFLHNKGDGNFQTSTMRRDANAGNWSRPAVKTCAGTRARSMACPWCCPA
jgi:GH24 family phage-related lysozyme (muramidase)